MFMLRVARSKLGRDDFLRLVGLEIALVGVTGVDNAGY